MPSLVPSQPDDVVAALQARCNELQQQLNACNAARLQAELRSLELEDQLAAVSA